MLRLSGVGGLLAERPLGIVTPFLVKSRRLFVAGLAAVRLGVWFRRPLFAGSIARAGVAVERCLFTPRRMRPLLCSRLALRALGQRLDADVVLLVGAPDLDGKGLRGASGDLELGRRIHDADGADIILVDAAAAADHRQQPAPFRGLLGSHRSAGPA